MRDKLPPGRGKTITWFRYQPYQPRGGTSERWISGLLILAVLLIGVIGTAATGLLVLMKFWAEGQ